MLPELILLVQLASGDTAAVPRDTLRLLPQSPVSADSIRLPMPARPDTARRVTLGRAYEGWKITRFSVHGVPRGVGTELKRGLALVGSAKWLVLWSRPPFSPTRLKEDLDRARLFLARNGYPSATVTPRLSPRPDGRSLGIDLDVVPGPRLIVAANRTEAVPPALQPRADRILRLKRDETFDDATVEHHITRLLSLLQEHGYARARVHTRIQPIDSTHVAVLFRVVAGPVYRFGGTRVNGSPSDLVATVQRTVAIRPGTQYSPSRLHRAEDGLRLLDLFRQVDVTTADAGDDSLDIVADVAPRAPRTATLGVGYFTDNLAQISGEWKHRDLFGGGRGFSSGATVSKYLQQGIVTLWKPVLFHSRTRGSLSLDFQRQYEPLYTLRSVDLTAAAEYQQSERTTYRPSITASRIWLSSPAPLDSLLDVPRHSLVSVGARWNYTAVNNPLNPVRGMTAWASGEIGMPDFRVADRYALLESEVSRFHPLVRRIGIAARVHAGVALPVANAFQLLPNKRFYSGGAGSMRGYRRHELGPLDIAGRPLGGVALLESSLELRFPLFGRIRGAGFVDAGNVWTRRSDYLRDVAVAVGPGVLVPTPIGLVQLYMGFLATTPEPGQPRNALQLEIGNGF